MKSSRGRGQTRMAGIAQSPTNRERLNLVRASRGLRILNPKRPVAGLVWQGVRRFVGSIGSEKGEAEFEGRSYLPLDRW